MIWSQMHLLRKLRYVVPQKPLKLLCFLPIGNAILKMVAWAWGARLFVPTEVLDSMPMVAEVEMRFGRCVALHVLGTSCVGAMVAE